jgi:hypothetical protein
MTTEIEPSFPGGRYHLSYKPWLGARSVKKGNSYFITCKGRIVLLCEPCFQTCNLLYKQQINKREEDGEILEDDLDRSAI